MKNEEAVRFFAASEHIFELLLQKWYVLEEIEKVLFLPYLTTTELQKKSFCLTDFYGCYKIIEIKLEQMVADGCSTNLAVNLLTQLTERKPKLIENQIMLCAIFLDPRFKKDLDRSPEKSQFVKTALVNMWKHMESIKETVKEASGNVANEQQKKQPKKHTMASFLDELDEIDEANDQYTSLTSERNQNSTSNTIELAIYKYESFVKDIRVKSSESVQMFWDTNKENLGTELYKIACIVHTVPPTQASVERTFSALKYLFSYYRYRLSERMLESLMLVHTNSDFYYLIKKAELDELDPLWKQT